MSDAAHAPREPGDAGVSAPGPAAPTPAHEPPSRASPSPGPVRLASRLLLWSILLGGASVLFAGPVARRVVGPAVHLLVRPPAASWNPAVAGLSFFLAGLLVAFILGLVIELPPAIVAAGLGGGGAAWLALLVYLTQGPRALARLPFLAQIAVAAATAWAAAAVARRRARKG